MLADLYAKLFRPILTVVAGLGAVSCLFLLLWSTPRSERIDPDVLLGSLIGVLAVLGVLVPALLAVLRASAEPHWWGPAGLFLAGATNAAVLGGDVAEPPAQVTLILAIALSLLMSTVGLISVGERQANKPGKSRF